MTSHRQAGAEMKNEEWNAPIHSFLEFKVIIVEIFFKLLQPFHQSTNAQNEFNKYIKQRQARELPGSDEEIIKSLYNP